MIVKKQLYTDVKQPDRSVKFEKLVGVKVAGKKLGYTPSSFQTMLNKNIKGIRDRFTLVQHEESNKFLMVLSEIRAYKKEQNESKKK